MMIVKKITEKIILNMDNFQKILQNKKDDIDDIQSEKIHIKFNELNLYFSDYVTKLDTPEIMIKWGEAMDNYNIIKNK